MAEDFDISQEETGLVKSRDYGLERFKYGYFSNKRIDSHQKAFIIFIIGWTIPLNSMAFQ